jgi:hypothetical protein
VEDAPAAGFDEAGLLARHLRRLRIVWAAFVATGPVAVAMCFGSPHRTTEVGSPAVVTLLVVTMSLWVAFTAERDARLRLERVKLAFAVHADVARLLRDHTVVLLVVLTRLEIIVLGGVVAGVWGAGPWAGLWLVLAGVLMMARTWPNAIKSQNLVNRARERLP